MRLPSTATPGEHELGRARREDHVARLDAPRRAVAGDGDLVGPREPAAARARASILFFLQQRLARPCEPVGGLAAVRRSPCRSRGAARSTTMPKVSPCLRSGSTSSAPVRIALVGMQPQFRQTPPRSVLLDDRDVAGRAARRGSRRRSRPGPEPITTRSKRLSLAAQSVPVLSFVRICRSLSGSARRLNARQATGFSMIGSEQVAGLRWRHVAGTRSAWTRSCSLIRPSSTASGRGGQPGM